MDSKLARWLAGRDTGASSKAIALFMSAGVETGETPSDPADLGRCLRLLELFPEWKPRMSEMQGGFWPTFARHWDEMAASMAREVGIDWSKGREARETYALMKQVRDEAYLKAGYQRMRNGWVWEAA